VCANTAATQSAVRSGLPALRLDSLLHQIRGSVRQCKYSSSRRPFPDVEEDHLQFC